MKHLLLALAVLVCVGAIPAQSATVSYAVDAIFENDGVYELGTPDGSTSYYGEDCVTRAVFACKAIQRMMADTGRA